MKKWPQIRTAVLRILMLLFAVLALAIGRVIKIHFSVLAALAVVFGLLGLILIILSARLTGSRTQQTLLILTGISAAGIPISAILHNLLYGLFITWFGEKFWGPDGDEPVFFILAIFIFPALFMISSVASGILLLKAKIARNETGRATTSNTLSTQAGSQTSKADVRSDENKEAI
ncbi:MAG: hypothetical protein KKC51_01850 [Verrucomicrobia bacterium]|nr:hypothetical protein [Verrucomicrobiota bacterium]